MIHLVLILAHFADPPVRMQFVYTSAWLRVDITSLILSCRPADKKHNLSTWKAWFNKGITSGGKKTIRAKKKDAKKVKNLLLHKNNHPRIGKSLKPNPIQHCHDTRFPPQSSKPLAKWWRWIEINGDWFRSSSNKALIVWNHGWNCLVILQEWCHDEREMAVRKKQKCQIFLTQGFCTNKIITTRIATPYSCTFSVNSQNAFQWPWHWESCQWNYPSKFPQCFLAPYSLQGGFIPPAALDPINTLGIQ